MAYAVPGFMEEKLVAEWVTSLASFSRISDKRKGPLDTLFQISLTILTLDMAPAAPFKWVTVASTTAKGMWFNLYINLTGAQGAFHTLSVPVRVKKNLYLTKQIHPIYCIYFDGCFFCPIRVAFW